VHRRPRHLPDAELTLATIRLRKETAKDDAFLRRLFISNRWEGFAALPAAPRPTHLAGQFALQDNHFRTFFPETDRRIVMCAGKPVGRLYVLRGEKAHNLIDISLLPEWTGQGIGGRLLDGVLADADKAGVPVTLHAAINSPARALYERKGFVDIRLDGMDWLMERPARG
jgi:GNAT superfamily N-acetyltransferase